MSENIRKTNGFDSFLAIGGSHFGTHFGVTFGSPPGSCLLGKLNKNERSGEPDAKEMDADPQSLATVLQKECKKVLLKSELAKKLDRFTKK